MGFSTCVLDTSIWIDIYDKRDHNGEVAKKLLEMIIIEDDSVLYSDIVVAELKKLGFSDYEVHEILTIPNKVKRANVTKNQFEEAKNLAKKRDVPMRDALHAIISRDNDAQLVSRDWDFDKLKDITRAKKPEDLL